MREHKDKHLVERAFTLIETLVVVAILGVLAAVVVFSLQGLLSRGDITACATEVSTVNNATQAFYAVNKTYPGASATPPDDSVDDLGSTLVSGRLLAAGSAFPGATEGHSPAYDPTSGSFTAAC